MRVTVKEADLDSDVLIVGAGKPHNDERFP